MDGTNNKPTGAPAGAGTAVVDPTASTGTGSPMTPNPVTPPTTDGTVTTPSTEEGGTGEEHENAPEMPGASGAASEKPSPVSPMGETPGTATPGSNQGLPPLGDNPTGDTTPPAGGIAPTTDEKPQV